MSKGNWVWGRKVHIVLRLIMGAAAYIAALVVQFGLLGPSVFWAGWALALVAAGLAFGASTMRPGRDNTYRVRNWGPAPWQVIPGTVLLVIWAMLVLKPREPKPSYGPDSGLFPSLTPNGYEPPASAWWLVAVVAVLWVGFVVWMWVKKVLPSMNFQIRDKTAEERALDSVNTSIFRNANLTLRSQFSQEDRYPTFLGKGLNSDGDPFFDVKPIPGQPVRDFHKQRERLITSWVGVRDVDIDEVDKDQHVVRITGFCRATGIQGEVNWTPAPSVDMPIAQYISALPMGAYVQTGRPWTINLSERHFIIGGKSGWGKSSFANAMLAHLVRHPDVRIAYVDLKMGAEAAPWGPRMDAIVSNPDGDAGVQRSFEFIQAAVSDVRARYTRMIQAGKKNAWTQGFLGPKEPLKILVIDECSELFKSATTERSKMAAQIEEELKTFIQQGRAAGYILMMMTQFPKEENLPNSIRQVASDKVAFRVDTSGRNAVLDPSYIPPTELADPTQINVKGQAVVLSADSSGDRIQMPWFDEENTTPHAQRYAAYRREWLDVPVKFSTPEPLMADRVAHQPTQAQPVPDVPTQQAPAGQAPTQAQPVYDVPTQPAPPRQPAVSPEDSRSANGAETGSQDELKRESKSADDWTV